MINKTLEKIRRNILVRKIYFSFSRWFFEIKYLFQKKLMRSSLILLYHRVDNPQNDPFSLSVSPEIFRKQLEYLKSKFTIVRLSELIQEIENGVLSNKVCITFDDGYEDNLENALSILQDLNVPATFFITTEYLDKKGYFYWEQSSPADDRGRPISKESLVKLASSDLVELGAHTVSHPNLKSLNDSDQRHEILESKIKLEKIIGKKIDIFSYPFGTRKYYSKTTKNIVKEEGYSAACANNQGRVTFFSDIFALPRIVVRNNFNDFVSKL